MPGTWNTARREVTAHLKTELTAAVRQTARDVLAAATVEAPRKTGALAQSGYVVSATESGYEQAAERAQSANPKAEIVEAAYIAPYAGHVRAAVAYATQHALYINNGFHHARGGYRVPGVFFLDNAAVAQQDAWIERLQEILSGLSAIDAPTRAERQQARESASEAQWQAQQNRRINAELRANAVPFADLVQMSGEKLTRLRQPSGHYETMGEMWERVRNAAAHARQFDR